MFDLYNELMSFEPYDELESKTKIKFLEYLKTGKNLYDRSNFVGHITAGGFVADTSGNILLNHHKKSGRWFQFGGHSDNDSNSYNVAKREVYEEAGISEFAQTSNKIFNIEIYEIMPMKSEPAHLHYDVNFLFIVKDHFFKPSNESLEIKWVDIKTARALTHQDDKGFMRMLDKYANILEKQNNQKQSFQNSIIRDF